MLVGFNSDSGPPNLGNSPESMLSASVPPTAPASLYEAKDPASGGEPETRFPDNTCSSIPSSSLEIQKYLGQHNTIHCKLTSYVCFPVVKPFVSFHHLASRHKCLLGCIRTYRTCDARHSLKL